MVSITFIIQLKDMTKTSHQGGSLLVLSQKCDWVKTSMTTLCTIPNHHHLHHSLVPDIRHRVASDTILYMCDLPLEPNQISHPNMLTTAFMLVAKLPIMLVASHDGCMTLYQKALYRQNMSECTRKSVD
jgi:hypothetical protein